MKGKPSTRAPRSPSEPDTSRRSGDAGAHRGRDAHPQPGHEEPLDERKAAILNAVVAEYIQSAQPVGSAHVIGSPGIEVSAATVRSDMAALEREGYLVQPHTSAGRAPTDKGYRFFVDHMATPGTLGPGKRHEVRQFFAHVHGEVEELLGRTSGLLTHLTDYAAVVVGPSHETATVRSVQLVGLAPTVALAVVVLSDGAVEKQTIELPITTTDERLEVAAALLTAHLRGSTLARREGVPDTGDLELDTLVHLGHQALERVASSQEPENVFVGGSSRMAAAFDAVETVRSVLSILEEQLVVVELIEEILDRGLSVAIGAEHGFEPLASCALVVAPVSVGGESAGTVGVLGPTRMNYPLALAAVELVGQRLGEHLGGSSARRARPATESPGRGADKESRGR